MVVRMSSGRISRYKEEAKAEIIRCNRRQIRCPCRKCKLVSWIDPDSGQLEDPLLRRGFMVGFNHDERDVGGQDHHDDEGDAGRHGHDEGVYGGGEDANTQTLLTSALRDSHVDRKSVV